MTIHAGHYTSRRGRIICEQIAMGKTLEEALDVVGFDAPTITQFFTWLDTYPDYREKYERARMLAADMDADHIKKLAKQVVGKQASVTGGYRVAIDALKWQAEMRNRSKYGNKAPEAPKMPMDPKQIREEIKRLEKELGMVEEPKPGALKVVK